ncbi:MAG: Hydrolase, TatD family [Candidatus Daviesbacteria bacterium GW2011_GWA1_41_61]|uniref:Hydrolase, TatD family n=1 Tax=Candidatus Daviesbacteria bacterium GW2011_GWA2_40_9 TaxID=1618424 RepID=A0A0G0U2U4_9BACT|nr:MAG: Hydrolase, TatD family [Candidatus Daviesbacteria bacterium GW2011_GWC1_40_9]KKR83423.1 MAG: Hydrolase, TatD family [Candidatus Daviesbacteria bacterium GW2011_GWA2_40_9]KKR93805.1 MAG: Hydrolase, TatD family [Candidatus Daviesbacteria bacterium GW2011_GWB1_41_15]KKS15271.1 MAG: Hydrolase, TatD family [Candidatus Daviesbacteria bacterium GW2011_GWA1_41_61]
MLIDTHAHLTWDSFEPDLEAVVQKAADTGLKAIINIGADLESSLKAAQLKSPTSQISFYSTIGLHPHETSKLSNYESIYDNINRLETIYQNYADKVVALGECGLDYYFAGADFTPSTLSQETLIKLQKELFLGQINLAKKLSLPLIIHCRDCWQDIFLPELEGTQGVFHSFTGSSEDAHKALSLGYYLGFSCPITYPKNDALREIIKTTPLDKILTETDCPFLPPQSQRGQRNEPANILEVIKVIAQVKNLSEGEVSHQVFKNATQLFALPSN